MMLARFNNQRTEKIPCRSYSSPAAHSFIGSAFVRLALELWPDCEIVSFDADICGESDNLIELLARHHFVKGDIAVKSAVLEPR
jgi:dTDP-D-glucose 4,6-dehydratase